MRNMVLLAVLVGVLACSEKNNVLIALHDDEKLPENSAVPFELHQNFPNPFNPATTIRYGMLAPMAVRLDVWTVDWQRVATLYHGQRLQGTYSVVFDANDLASGEYYYTLKGGGYTLVRKLKLVK